MRLTDKVAIITGGASGIGEATARLFAKEGAHVAIFDINDGRGASLAAALSASGRRALYVHCDVSDESQVAAAVASAFDSFGRIDILFNNAGAQPTRIPLDETSMLEWDRILNTHLKGCMLCSKHVYPHLKAQRKGVIVNTASHAGLVAMSENHPYTAAKHGIVGLTKSMALELAPHGIRVCAVAPGAIDTPMLRRGENSLSEERLRSIRERHPLGGPGDPEDVAYGVLYLACDEAKFVTGIVLSIDGGYTAR
jgi:NAD(P)-dependent dehydrogenase (short-subunit alcohol dehydrogenase family)